jgi:hypothetical protein
VVSDESAELLEARLDAVVPLALAAARSFEVPQAVEACSAVLQLAVLPRASAANVETTRQAATGHEVVAQQAAPNLELAQGALEAAG